MEDDGCETTMRNYAIDPVKESHEQAYYENRCSINRLESGTVSPGPARFPLSWKLGGGGRFEKGKVDHFFRECYCSPEEFGPPQPPVEIRDGHDGNRRGVLVENVHFPFTANPSMKFANSAQILLARLSISFSSISLK